MVEPARDECPHWWLTTYIPEPVYPVQHRLKPGEAWCHTCEEIIPDPAAEHEKFVAAQECLRGPDGCRGPIRERVAAGGTTMIYECETHMAQSMERLDRISRDYPDSPVPPSWFDPAYAGERWDDDY